MVVLEPRRVGGGAVPVVVAAVGRLQIPGRMERFPLPGIEVGPHSGGLLPAQTEGEEIQPKLGFMQGCPTRDKNLMFRRKILI